MYRDEPLTTDWFEVGLIDSERGDDARSEYEVEEGCYGLYLDGYSEAIWHSVD
jgi:hypothetical protein